MSGYRGSISPILPKSWLDGLKYCALTPYRWRIDSLNPHEGGINIKNYAQLIVT